MENKKLFFFLILILIFNFFLLGEDLRNVPTTQNPKGVPPLLKIKAKMP